MKRGAEEDLYNHMSSKPLVFPNPYYTTGYKKIYSVKTRPLEYTPGVAQDQDKQVWSKNPYQVDLDRMQKMLTIAPEIGESPEYSDLRERAKLLYEMLTPYKQRAKKVDDKTPGAKREEYKNAIADARTREDGIPKNDKQKEEAIGKSMPIDEKAIDSVFGKYMENDILVPKKVDVEIKPDEEPKIDEEQVPIVVNVPDKPPLAEPLDLDEGEEEPPAADVYKLLYDDIDEIPVPMKVKKKRNNEAQRLQEEAEKYYKT